MVREYEEIKSRVKAQGTIGKLGSHDFEEITLLEYLEYFKNRMLVENSPMSIMTLVQYYKKL